MHLRCDALFVGLGCVVPICPPNCCCLRKQLKLQGLKDKCPRYGHQRLFPDPLHQPNAQCSNTGIHCIPRPLVVCTFPWHVRE